MKVCPACRTTFDDSQNFCLSDGTPLVAAEPEHDPDTETVVVQRESNVEPRSYQSLPRTPAVQAPPVKKSNNGLLIGGTALATLLLVGLGAGAWLMMSRGSDNRSDNVNQQVVLANTNANTNANSISNLNSNLTPRSFPPATTTNSTSEINNPPENSQVPANPEATPFSNNPEIAANPEPPPTPAPIRLPARETTTIRKQVSGTLNSWANAIEDGDFNRHLSYYADTLEYYYTARGFSKNQVSADKQRAFEAFDDIEFNISNIRVMPESGDRVVVVYDKEWSFSNDDGRTSEGKVQSQITLQRINGRWLIVGERDLRVYFQESR